MLFERIYDEDLSQASYIVGCQAKGEAIVIDPRRDIDTYLAIAKANGMTIVGVTETHIHADYLSGTREVAAATGATIYISGEGGVDWQYGFDGTRLSDGDRIRLGNVVLEAVHTPGHTPEHLSFLVTDGAATENPGYLLSGDFVFAGDLGRPDLLDEAAGGVDTRFQGAKDMFASLRDRFLTLPDYIQVYPAHGAGSACGKALGSIPSTTVGYERLYSWWGRYLADNDEAGFIAELLDGQPDAPAYFGRMKRQNKSGPAILGELAPLPALEPSDVAADLSGHSIIFIDTRPNSQVHEGTPEGALNIPAAGKFASYAGWAVDPESDNRPVVFLAGDAEAAGTLRDHIIRVGIDNIAGFVNSVDSLPLVTPKLTTVDEVLDLEKALLLDVRAKSEFDAGSVPGAVQLHGGRVLWNLDGLPKNGTIVTYCQSGVRSSIVSSVLRAHGYDVVELEGSYLAWARREAEMVSV